MNLIQEKQVERRFKSMEIQRLEKGIEEKSFFEEAMSSYFCENYRAAFIMAYTNLISPIAINSKRLHKKRNRKKFAKKKDPFKFNLNIALEECLFLSDELKSEILKEYNVALKYYNSEKYYKETLSIAQIRNITVHPEDYRHKILIGQFSFKEPALSLLSLAPRVHESYKEYLSDIAFKSKRKSKEREIYNNFVYAS